MRSRGGTPTADLVAEGRLTARQGSGTRVAERTVVPPAGTAPRRREPGRPEYDLRPGFPDLASFPRTAWLRAARRALTSAPYEAFGYGDPRGRPELRTALAGYLSRVRGVRTDPDRILVCGGFSHGLRILGTVLRARGMSTVAVESYGLRAHWKILRATGLHTTALPFDELGTNPGTLCAAPVRGAGLHPSAAPQRGATSHDGPADNRRHSAAPTTEHPRAVLLTPAHQFPMGSPLHRDRRTAVVDWARRTDGLVLEDDYDGEFRCDRQPVGALQGLDPDRVVYLGTASKSLAPGLRLAWMVLPPTLMEEATAAKGGMTRSGCWTS